MKLNVLNRLHRNSSTYVVFIKVMLVLTWMTVFEQADPDAIGSVYTLCGFACFFCMWANRRKSCVSDFSCKTVIIVGILAGLFAVAVPLANYSVFEPIRSKESLLKFGLCALGGGIVAWEIFLCAMPRLPVATAPKKREHPIAFFLVCFGLTGAVYMLYLFCVAYPGYFTQDTIAAFNDIVSGEYARRIPVYHTLLIELCLNIGYFFGGAGNSALVVYPLLQSLALAACCAYVMVTLYEIDVPGWCMAVVFLLYTFLPWNVAYSVTIWKDIPFSIAALAIAASLYRIAYKIGNSVGNYVVFGFSGLVFCLSRTNGWYSFLGLLLIMILVLHRQHKKLLLLAILIVLSTWLLLNPILDTFTADTSDYLEAMSIPFQQIARVVSYGHDLPEADVQFLSKYLDLEMVADLYDPQLVDPIKYECFDRTKYHAFMDELGTFVSVWIRWGIEHPLDYLKAWIDQTKGYWNGGYRYLVWVTCGEYSPLGFVRVTYDNPVAKIFERIFQMFDQDRTSSLMLLRCIGLHVWILLGCMAVGILQKRKTYLIGIPACTIVIGLWLCTPLYSEFRYAYAVFLTVPLILCATIFHKNTDSNEPGLSS